jgi:hypothetical protein
VTHSADERIFGMADVSMKAQNKAVEIQNITESRLVDVDMVEIGFDFID